MFVGLLVYSVIVDKDIAVISLLVWLSGITWGLMKSSSETLNNFITNMSEAFKNKWGK